MADKKTKSYILRIDAETMDAIEAWAADEFRSTNGQLQWIITEALRKAKRLPKKQRTLKNEESNETAKE
ncbi:MAG: hypothetical protein II886_01445 [Prevotella sp.]|nr:hypothetical protein [Prevotella sp.]